MPILHTLGHIPISHNDFHDSVSGPRVVDIDTFNVL